MEWIEARRGNGDWREGLRAIAEIDADQFVAARLHERNGVDDARDRVHDRGSQDAKRANVAAPKWRARRDHRASEVGRLRPGWIPGRRIQRIDRVVFGGD